MPKISVILTSYNHETHIKQSIESVLNQSLNDFELIIWDDASKDKSWKIIQSFSDPRIKTFQNKANRRGMYGINKAIMEVAQGEYVAIHHSDDVWESDKLEKQIGILEKNKKIGAIFTNAEIITDDGNPLEDETHYYFNIFNQPNRSRHEWLRHFFLQGNALCHPSVLIRKTCYEDCGAYRPGFAQLGDFDMWVRLCMKYEIHVLPEKLVRFRIHEDEGTVSGDRPETKPRIFFEFYELLDSYLNIDSFKEIVKVFPEAEKYKRKGGFDPGFVLGMIALELKPYVFTELFGLDVLQQVLRDPERANKVETLYDFSIHDFLKLTSEHDVFSFFDQSEMEKKEWTIQEQEKALQGYKDAILGKDEYIKKQSQVISNKEKYIAEQVKAIEGKDIDLQEKEQAIQGKELAIKEKEKIIKEKEKVIKGKEQYLDEKEQIVQARDLKIQDQEKALQEKEKVIQGKDQFLYDKEQAIQLKDASIKNLQDQLGEVYSSWSWRLVTMIRRMRRALFPEDSLRGKFYRWVLRKIRGNKKIIQKAKDLHRKTVQSEGGDGVPVSQDLPPKEWWPALSVLEHIPTKIAPLKLKINSEIPRRVNIVFSEIRFKYFFGGYYAVFNMALKIRSMGHQVRILLVDRCYFDIDVAREKIKKYKGLEDFFDKIEVIEVSDRSRAVDVNPDDCFLASSWWTAHIAHAASQEIGKEKFIYLTQEFEPLFYPGGSYYALALESYDFPHNAIYSTELLRSYARKNRIGVYRWGAKKGDEHSIAFQNAVIATPPTLNELKGRESHKLIFYSRLEQHARRNIFELGTLALRKFIKENYDDLKSWEFDGMGSVNLGYDIDLYKGKKINILPKMSLNDYYEKIKEYDIGLSLMMSPHPSLVPMDLAGSGVLAVTNTLGIKTPKRLTTISKNIIPVQPGIDSIAEGLRLAKKRIYNYEARISNAKLNWAQNWNESYHDEFVKTIDSWIIDLQKSD